MKVLGINAFGTNASACLLEDGALVGFCQEERLNRLKSSHDMFPSQAVRWLMTSQKLSLKEIDAIAFPWDAHKYPFGMLRHAFNMRIKMGANPIKKRGPSADMPLWESCLHELLRYTPKRVISLIHDHLRLLGFSGDMPPIRFVPHHLSHAYQAFCHSKFDDAAVLVIDGSGEEVCTQGFVANASGIHATFNLDIPHSLGWFYAAVTAYCGFIPYRDEGKLMGLAALGEDRKHNNPWREHFKQIVSITDESYEIDGWRLRLGNHSDHAFYSDGFTDFVTSHQKQLTAIRYGEKVQTEQERVSKYLLSDYIDFAFAAQEILEQAGLSVARRALRISGSKNLCVVGGVAMNCKLNGQLSQLSEGFFAHPASSDDGSCLGAAMMVSESLGCRVKDPLHHAQWGPHFSPEDIRNCLNESKLSFKEVDPAHEAAKGVAEGKLVGWFQGGVEMGARALGGRSILANPQDPKAKDRVNSEVKFRESWRPFCPSMTASAADKFLKQPKDPRYMIVACDATRDLKDRCPSVVHVDGSVRPQVVTQELLEYSRYLNELERLTGHGISLNTSFNVRGEPMVASPQDALRCFYASGLDNLIIGPFLVSKNSK